MKTVQRLLEGALMISDHHQERKVCWHCRLVWNDWNPLPPETIVQSHIGNFNRVKTKMTKNQLWFPSFPSTLMQTVLAPHAQFAVLAGLPNDTVISAGDYQTQCFRILITTMHSRYETCS